MTAKARILPAGEGEVLRLRPPSRSGEVVVKVDPRSTGAEHFSLGTQRVEPGGRIPVHLHQAQEEVLFIRAGRGVVIVEEEQVAVEPGAVAYIPPQTWHGVLNPHAEPLDLLWIISPPGLEEMFRAIGTPPGETAAPLTNAEFAAAAQRHGMRVKEG